MTPRSINPPYSVNSMTKSHSKSLRIATTQDRTRLSSGQQEFNALISMIGGKRAKLAAWEAAIPPYQQKYVSQMVPLLDAVAEQESRLVLRLDEASFDKALSRAERKMISELIVEIAGDLVAARDDPGMKAIYNKHSRSDYDQEEAAEAREMQSVLEQMLGVELGGDEDAQSPDDMFGRTATAMHEKQAEMDAARQAHSERAPRRGKSAKQKVLEARKQDEAKLASLSIREVYRKLASVLHPDRETDPAERNRKTALMQRVNQAYAKNNLLQLLELQLELEHIDQHAIDNLGEDRLRHYNNVLRGQLRELDQEIAHVEAGFRDQFGLAPFAAVSPKSVLRKLALEMAGVQQDIDELSGNLRACRDINGVKAWLKQLRQQRRMSGPWDLPF